MARAKTLLRRTARLVVMVPVAALLCNPSPAWAQSLGSASSFGVLGGLQVTAGAGGATVNGDVGVSPGISITGPITVVPPFAIHNNDAAAIAAQASTGTLFTTLNAGACTALLSDDLTGQSLGPGCYSGGALLLNGSLTLTGPGPHIFRAASSLTANVGSSVSVTNPCNVFWRVVSLATLNGAFVGNVVAQANPGVSLGVGATLTGRALTTAAGGVTMAGGNTVGGCSAAAAPPPPPPPGGGAVLSISKTHSGNFTVGTNGTFTITVSNIGAVATSGTITVTDTLPAGLTFVSATGAGWSCSASGQTVTCTSSTPIPAGGVGNPITVTVSPQAAGVGTQTNTATVTGGGGVSNPVNTTTDVVAVCLPADCPAPVPTLPEWAMILLAALLTLVGFAAMRRRVGA